MQGAPPSPRWILPVAVAGAILFGLLALASVRPGSTDDLFVVLVYARNLLEHGALAHELGEGRLEGFTSPLDLALKTVALALHPVDGVRAAWVVTSAAFLSVLLAGAWAAWRWGGGKPVLVGLGALALALGPGLAEGTTYLLETPLVLLLLLGAAGRLTRAPTPPVAAAGVLILGLARPEAGLVALAWLWPHAGARSWRPLAAGVGALAAITVVRLALFGRLAPQSYYAKTSDSLLAEWRDGARYVADFVTQGGVELPARVLVLAAVVLAPWLARGGPAHVRVLARAAPVALLLVVLSGGDGYAGARLLAPPLYLATLSLIAVAGSSVDRPRVALTAVLVLAVGTLSLGIAVLPGAPAKLAAVVSGGLDTAAFEPERRALRALASRLPAGATLAARHLQMAEYFQPDLGYLDLTGINERSVSAAPAPGPVRFGRTSLEPALAADVEAVHLHHQALSSEVLAERPLSAWFAAPEAERALLGDPLPAGDAREAWIQRYRTATLLHAGGPGLHLNLLVRRDVAARWEAEGAARVGTE